MLEEEISIAAEKSNILQMKALIAVSAMMMLDSVAYTLLLETGNEYDGIFSDISVQRNSILDTIKVTDPNYNFTWRATTWYTKPKDISFQNFCCALRSLILMLASLFSDALIRRISCFWSMTLGSLIMFISTTIIGLSKSNVPLLIGSILQGLGSPLVTITCSVIIVTLFKGIFSRTRAFATMVGIQRFGSFVISPLLSSLYMSSRKLNPYVILAVFYVMINIILIIIFIRMMKTHLPLFNVTTTGNKVYITSFWQLLLDSYVLLRAFLLLASTEFFLFFYYKDGKPRWMDNSSNDWISWILVYIPYVLGAGATAMFFKHYSRHKIMIICVGLALEGLFCFMQINKFVRVRLGYAAFIDATTAVVFLAKFAQHVNIFYNPPTYGNVYVIVNIVYNLPHAVRHLFDRSLYNITYMVCLKLALAIQSLLKNVVLGLLRPVG